MQGYNVIVVFDQAAEKILMCKRRKDPYKGLSNFVGGKIEPNEDGYTAAYRELEEETSITPKDIHLSHLMDYTYHFSDLYLEVYVGRLNKQMTVSGSENKLYWTTPDQDFFDTEKYAGEGNIGHIMLQVALNRDKLLTF